MKFRAITCRLLVLTLLISVFSGVFAAGEDSSPKAGTAGSGAAGSPNTVGFSDTAGISGASNAAEAAGITSTSGPAVKYVLHIVWDGLSSSLYSELKANGLATPNMDELVTRGTTLANVSTTVPSYGGAQAALVTGAFPGTNGFTYRYYDKATNTIISNTASTYKMNGQTVFEAVNATKPDLRTLATGYSVATLSLGGRGVSVSDEKHKLIEYARGDSLVGFAATGSDIVSAINSEAGLPNYTLAYSNDIKMLYWNGGASDPAIISQKLSETVAGLDSKLGDIIGALKAKGIYDDTAIILHSLSGVYTTKGKVDGGLMAADITAQTGVPASFGTVSASTKAVLVKAYIMKYVQLSFTNLATQEDKDKVLAYLADKTTGYGKYVKSVLNPVDYRAPSVFADYLINPLTENTYSAAGSNCFRTDNLDDMNQFCIVSGAGVIKGATVGASSVADIAPAVCRLLGINPPQNNEGTAWNIFDLEAPSITVTVDGPTDANGIFTGKALVTISASDNNGIASLKYDTGEGFKDYTAPFEIDRDCTLKVKAEDAAGNSTTKERSFVFVKIIGEVGLSGDFEKLNDCCYTDSAGLTVTGTVLVSDGNPTVKINGNPVNIVSGAFSQDVELADGLNIIDVQAYLNDIGNSVKIKVCKMFNPKITSFKDGDKVSDPKLDVAGTAAPGTAVAVNKAVAEVDIAGAFKMQVNLVEGLNNIEVVSTTGTYLKYTVASVSYFKPAVINVTNVADKQVVRDAVFKVRGSVDKKCIVSVNGTEAVLDDALNFSADVALGLGVNSIQLKADCNGIVTEKTIKLVRVDPDDVYTVYINWDGFAKYYYDLANTNGVNGTPVLNNLLANGVFFTDAQTGIPSITNPMQASILSGAWPAVTGNCYRYYDKGKNTVIQFARENRAETIAEAVLRQGLEPASVNQFMLLDRGTTAGDTNKPYIDAGGAYDLRFDAAIKLVKGEEVGEGAGKIQLDEIPRFMALYMDDLDGIGHNEAATYGVPVAPDEAGRIAAVLERLKRMDTKLGEFIQACRDRGIYDNMAFVLTTDHGMARFGQQGSTADDYSYSKLPDLITTLDGLGYKSEVLFADQQPSTDTKIAIVCVGLQAQLSFTGSYTESDVDNIISALNGKPYIGKVMRKQEMLDRGVMEGFADLLISPEVPYSFKTVTYDKAYIARGQHDSLEEEAQHIFALMWGKGVKKGVVYTERMYNIDFAQTLTALMGIERPANATGPVLKNALEDGVPPVITVTGVKDHDRLKEANISISVSGGKVVESLLSGIPFNGGTVTTSGAYVLVVKASDLVGNISEKTVRFTIDNIAPVITITGVSDGDRVREVRCIKVTTNEPAHVTIRLNGHLYSGTRIEKPGRYILYVKAVDFLGNTSEKTITFTIDKKVKDPKKK